MDKQFTLKLQEWLNTPAEGRDYEQGALLVLQLTNNKILYRNISRDPKRHAEFIEFKIKRYLQYRLQDLTHEEVQDMQRKVDSIAVEHALDKTPAPTSEQGDTPSTEAAQFRAGKRADHDTLPPEIQALFVENADIMRKMRELHLQLRNLSTQSSTCPDSDRYPFLKELIELDKRYHHNWQVYDNFTPEHTESSATASLEQGGVATTSLPSAKAEVLLTEEMTNEARAEGARSLCLARRNKFEEQIRQQQKNILRQINLSKGRYKKNPSAELKDKIATLYGQLTAPSDALTADLKALGIV